MADAKLEVIQPFVDDLPDLDPVMFTERTANGWRGLTQQGEVLEVKATNGHAIEVPSEIVVAHAGKAIGRRAVLNDWTVDIDDYLKHFNAVVTHYRANRLEAALIESDATLQAAPTLRAKFNRAMILLASGHWADGFAEYWECEQHPPFTRPQVHEALAAGTPPWRGEDLHGKRLLVLHAHGFGDTIMMLRYLPTLRRMGADVVMNMPPELAPLYPVEHRLGVDYFCPILHLLHFLHVTPDNVDGRPYLVVARPRSRDNWATEPNVFPSPPRRVGIAWSIGKPSLGDYPREIPLEHLVAAFRDAEIHSVQIQGGDEARALGVHVHQFEDFADCARLMLQMDMIVSVDTAALHLAGAIGHPRVYGLLSHWSSWRWLARWYDTVKLCRQAEPDDWASALAQIHRG